MQEIAHLSISWQYRREMRSIFVECLPNSCYFYPRINDDVLFYADYIISAPAARQTDGRTLGADNGVIIAFHNYHIKLGALWIYHEFASIQHAAAADVCYKRVWLVVAGY